MLKKKPERVKFITEIEQPETLDASDTTSSNLSDYSFGELTDAEKLQIKKEGEREMTEELQE